jgi:hypothetical protein
LLCFDFQFDGINGHNINGWTTVPHYRIIGPFNTLACPPQTRICTSSTDQNYACTTLPTLSSVNQSCVPVQSPSTKHLIHFLSRGLRNLSTHRTKRPAPPYPRAHCAAVLVALFVGRAGDLYVLLSQYGPHLISSTGHRPGADAMLTGEPKHSAPMLVTPHSLGAG